MSLPDYSLFVAQSCERDPALRASLESGEFDRPQAAGVLRLAAEALLAAQPDEASFMDALRRLRRRELVRIAWRDLTGRAPLAEVLADLSELADATIGVALAFAERALEPRYGTARSPGGERQELIVLGMGKLGGRELNFSSDIDLVFLYPEPGETDGQRSIANEDYFTRLGQALIRLLDARTRGGHRVPRGHAPAAVRRTRAARHPFSAPSRATSSSTAATGNAMPT